MAKVEKTFIRMDEQDATARDSLFEEIPYVFRRHLISAATLVAAVLALAAAVPGSDATAAPSQQGPAAANGQPVGGISCDAQEGQRIHIHQHLVVLDHGHPVAIPPNVGQPAGKRCIYWVHTHTPDGIIHIEAPLNRSFNLGDFFIVWGQPLSRTQAASARAAKGQALKVWVNGQPYKGDPAKIPLVAHTDVTIEAGPPYSKPVLFTTWGPL